MKTKSKYSKIPFENVNRVRKELYFYTNSTRVAYRKIC